MNKLEIMKDSFNYKGPYIKEDYILTNFVKGFNEDLKYFGEETADLYKVLFGLNEEVDFLVEHQEEINEALENTKRPFLFERVMDNNNHLFEAIPVTSWASKTLSTKFGGKVVEPPLPPEGTEWVKSLKANPEQAKELQGILDKAVNAPDAASAREILKGLSAADAAGTAPAAKAVKTVAKTVAPQGFLASLLSGLGNAWNNVKAFFAGGLTSVGKAVTSGNFASLLSIPLVQAALATGGAVLAFKLLKKLFGNKIRDEGKLRTALGAR